MFDEIVGLEWPEVELGPLCPGEWVEEADLEDFPGSITPDEAWWVDPRDKGDELVSHLKGFEALDERLSMELACLIRVKCEEARIQWSTDKVTSLFFQAQTQADLDRAFALMGEVKDRGFVAGGVIALAKARVAQNKTRARKAQIDGLRELNRQMGDWARSISYRVRLDDEQEPVARRVRDQSWVLVEMRPGVGAICRGKNVRGRPVLMAEPEIFSFMTAQAV